MHDVAEANIGWRMRALRGQVILYPYARFAAVRDAEIMREAEKKNKCKASCGATASTVYAGCTRMLISAAWVEWVSKPTEIKSTPVSA